MARFLNKDHRPKTKKTPPGEPDGEESNEERLVVQPLNSDMNQPNLPEVEAIKKAAYVRT